VNWVIVFREHLLRFKDGVGLPVDLEEEEYELS